jgi:siderophore synthetase component
MVNQQYEPVQLLIRDFGDLRIHAPTLRKAGLTIEAYRPGHTLFEEDAPVLDKWVHAFMLCHLSELTLLLAKTYHYSENHFWYLLRQQTETLFDQLRSRVPTERWNKQRHALLEADWPIKSFIKMRLKNSSDDHHGRMPNPLKNSLRII